MFNIRAQNSIFDAFLEFSIFVISISINDTKLHKTVYFSMALIYAQGKKTRSRYVQKFLKHVH